MNLTAFIYICKLYINVKKNLPIGEIMNRIALKEVVKKNQLRKFEKSMCKFAKLKLDLSYF